MVRGDDDIAVQPPVTEQLPLHALLDELDLRFLVDLAVAADDDQAGHQSQSHSRSGSHRYAISKFERSAPLGTGATGSSSIMNEWCNSQTTTLEGSNTVQR